MNQELKNISSVTEINGTNIYITCENMILAGDLEGAEEYLENKICENPEDMFLLYLLGKVLHCKSQMEDARKVFIKIILKEPDFHLVRNDLAILYHETGDEEKALQLLKYAIDKNDYNYDIIRNYADILRQTENFSEAITTYIKILKEFKNDIEVLLILSELSFEAEKYIDCELYLDKILSLDKNNLQAIEIKKYLDQQKETTLTPKNQDKKKNHFYLIPA